MSTRLVDGAIEQVSSRLSTRFVVISIALLALIVRLIPLLVLPRGAKYDITSYQVVAKLVLAHHDVYAAPESVGRYPYLPFQLYFSALARLAAGLSPVPFVIWVKLPAVIADAAISAVIFLLADKRVDRTQALWSALLFGLCPISILVSAYHGQFDAIPLLCILLACYWFERLDDASVLPVLLAGLALGFAILDKTWPVVLIPAFILSAGQAKRAAIVVATAVVPSVAAIAVYTLAFHSSPIRILHRSIMYRSVIGRWGVTGIVALMPNSNATVLSDVGKLGPFAILGLVIFTLIVTRKRLNLIEQICAIILTFYVATAGFGVQYLVWIVPFAILCWQIRQLLWFVSAATAFLLIAYFGLEITSALWAITSLDTTITILRLSSIPAWLISVAWFAETLTNRIFLPSRPTTRIWLQLRILFGFQKHRSQSGSSS